MQILLVRPPTVIAKSELRPGASPPLGLAYVAASLIADGHDVSVIDAVGEALDQYSDVEGVPGTRRHGLDNESIVERIPDDIECVGVGCMFSTEWPVTRDMIQAIRAKLPEVPILAGGEHISACPEYVMADCPAIDYCVLGEGEGAVVELVRALSANTGERPVIPGVLSRGQVRREVPRRIRLRELDELPRPAWHLFPLEPYIQHAAMPGVDLGRSIPMMASRGCPYECTFCSNPQMWGRLWKPRNPSAVLQEMKHYVQEYGVTNFDFYDLTAIVRKDWILEMSDLIIESGLSITWQLPSGTRSEALDEEVVDRLYRSGCRTSSTPPKAAPTSCSNGSRRW